MKVKAITLGCKVNTYESEYILSTFKDKGYQIITDNQEADIYIVNTCSVTNTSDAKSRKVINRLAKKTNSIIVVMGCMIEAHPDYQNEKVSIILGNKDKSQVLKLVQEYIQTKKPKKLLYSDFDKTFEDMFITNMTSHTRAFVKIQDGCENFCSYCIIPYTRGKQRSKEPQKVLDEITTLVNNNYQEVVLTGIHTGHYGSDLATNFSQLLTKICQIEKLKRLRISSIEITELDDEFLKVLADKEKIVNHLHIPLQSGCDKILKLMNRKYLTDYFANKVKQILAIRPDISLTTDIIVGFPGETSEDFEETLEFVKKIKFTKVHVFPYSRRKGTKADLMKEQIPENIKKERVNQLIKLSNLLEINYLEKYLNKEVLVLIEKVENNVSMGHTGNYLKVLINEIVPVNQIVKVKIIERKDMTLIGQLKENERN